MFKGAMLTTLSLCTQLYSIFIEYAKASPHLGMTLREFEEFLVQECNVSI